MSRKKFSSRRKVRKKSIFRRSWFLALVTTAIFGLGIAYVVFTILSKPYREQAEEVDLSLVNILDLPNIIYDREQREIGRLFVENRSPISIEEVPQKLIDALVSGEDSRFFEHDGVDFMGIGRAAYLNIKSGAEDSGASTLTMQLARNAFDLKEKARSRNSNKYERKIVEIFLARRLEKHFTKLEILEFYMNRVAFGNGYFGVRSAALGYFGKEPKDLDVQECASLVGCIKNPSTFSPVRSLTANKTARDHVLRRMEIEGRIDAKECARYIAMPVELNPKPIERNTSHIYDRVAEMVKKYIPEDQLNKGGCKVFTTIDMDMQRSIERGIRKQLAVAETHEGYKHPLYENYRIDPNAPPKYLQGAGMMVDHRTGELLAYVGGRDFRHSQYDFILSGRKQLGTAFFPVIYMAALEAGSNLATRLLDEAMDNRQVMIDGEEGILGEWGNEINNPRYEGEILFRRGLDVSKIAATVRLGRLVGLEKVSAMAKRFGFVMPKGELLTRFLLGTESASLSELVMAYGAFGNHGEIPSDLVWVKRIENADGKVIYQHNEKIPTRKVLHEATAYLGHTMLKSALKSGSGARAFEESSLTETFDGGGKTGTTSDFADNWFVGYNSEVSCGVWCGFWDGSRKAIYSGAFSVDTIMPCWLETMALYEKKYHPKEIEMPSTIEKVSTCKASGQRLTRDCQEYEKDPVTGKRVVVSTGLDEYFYVKNKPLGYCDQHGGGMYRVDANVFSASHIRADLSSVMPVQPLAPTLLGDDPYDSQQPAFVPLDAAVSGEARGIDAVNIDQLDELDREASITVSPPGKVKLLDE